MGELFLFGKMRKVSNLETMKRNDSIEHQFQIDFLDMVREYADSKGVFDSSESAYKALSLVYDPQFGLNTNVKRDLLDYFGKKDTDLIDRANSILEKKNYISALRLIDFNGNKNPQGLISHTFDVMDRNNEDTSDMIIRLYYSLTEKEAAPLTITYSTRYKNNIYQIKVMRDAEMTEERIISDIMALGFKKNPVIPVKW